MGRGMMPKGQIQWSCGLTWRMKKLPVPITSPISSSAQKVGRCSRLRTGGKKRRYSA